MGDSPEDSDVEDFTFGDFSLEDTIEFKKNYNGLPKKSTARRAGNNTFTGAEAVRPDAPEASTDRTSAGQDLVDVNSSGATAESRYTSTRPCSSTSALPVEPPPVEGRQRAPGEGETAAAREAPVAEGKDAQEGASTRTTPDDALRQRQARGDATGTGAQEAISTGTAESESTPSVPPTAPRSVRPAPARPMSWAAVAAGPKPAVPAGSVRSPNGAPSGSAQPPARAAGSTNASGSVNGSASRSAAGSGSSGSAAGQQGAAVADSGRDVTASGAGPADVVTPPAGVSAGEQAAGYSGGDARRAASDGAKETRAGEDGDASDRAEVAPRMEDNAVAKTQEMLRSLVRLLGCDNGAIGNPGAGGEGAGGGIPALGVDLVHRGMVNTGNTCFRSVVLQALLACEPFMRVLFCASPLLKGCAAAQEVFPTWTQLARFAEAFEPPKPGAAPLLEPKPKPTGSGRGKGEWSTAVSRSRGRHRGAVTALAPVLPDEEMSKAFRAFRSANTGEQEDAQEFMAFFLDQLHEEVVMAKKRDAGASKLVDGEGTSDGTGLGLASSHPSRATGNGESKGDAGGDAWLEVGKGGAKAVVNAPDPLSGTSKSSVITGLFYGMFRSEVKKSGSAKSSVTLEPFHCLQLDLDPPTPSSTGEFSSGGSGGVVPGAGAMNSRAGFENGNLYDGVMPNGGGFRAGMGGGGRSGSGMHASSGGSMGSWGTGAAWGNAGAGGQGAGATSLDEALAALFGGESVAGVKGRQNMEVKASRTLTLEQAPRVLTLHLKQFSFHPDSGPRKLARRVRYPLELTVPTKVMSPSLQHHFSRREALKYRLFTVVLHHGRSVHGGHYTALVRDARGAWRNCDDQVVSPEMEGNALNPPSGHPYLLLYTRM